jgi:hypothetical protein
MPAEHAQWNWGLYWIGFALGMALTLAVVGVVLGWAGDAIAARICERVLLLEPPEGATC